MVAWLAGRRRPAPRDLRLWGLESAEPQGGNGCS